MSPNDIWGAGGGLKSAKSLTYYLNGRVDTHGVFSTVRQRCPGPRQTSNFYRQYCDKKISNIAIKRYFFSLLCELKILFGDQLSTNVCVLKRFFFQKKYCLSFYRNVALSQYCLQKLLV